MDQLLFILQEDLDQIINFIGQLVFQIQLLQYHLMHQVHPVQ